MPVTETHNKSPICRTKPNECIIQYLEEKKKGGRTSDDNDEDAHRAV